LLSAILQTLTGISGDNWSLFTDSRKAEAKTRSRICMNDGETDGDGEDTDEMEDKEIVHAVIEHLDDEGLLVQTETTERDDSNEATLDALVEQFTEIQERTLDQLEHLTELQTEAKNGHETDRVDEEEPAAAPVEGATGRGFY
jgi:hypothetical protein